MSKTLLKLLITGFICALLGGCMTYSPTKAPCDQWATGCGQKTKINQW